MTASADATRGRRGQIGKWPRRGVAGLVAAGLLFAACGSDDDNSSADTAPEASAVEDTTPADTTPADTTPADSAPVDSAPVDSAPGSTFAPEDVTFGQGVTDSEILVGVSFDESGIYAPFASAARAALGAKVSLINDTGGLYGRQVKVIYLDDASDPAKVLTNFKRLWEQDKVLMIYTINAVGGPLEYVKSKEIPTVVFSGTSTFASKYPTVFPMGSMLMTWNAQAAYSVVNSLDRPPKVVAVSYTADEEPVLDWIEDYWTELGAEEVIFDIGDDPTANCDALILKYKDAGVEYWDIHGINWLSCIPAQVKAGWSPPLGQGGPAVSQIGLAQIIGKPMADLGVTAGSPATLADGAPVHGEPTPAHQEYMDAMEKYAPDFTTRNQLNGTLQMIYYTAGTLIEDAINGAGTTAGTVDPASVTKWIQEVDNWDPGLADPVASFAPDCKTGNDSTIWGTWKWDDATQELYMEPFAPAPGEPMVTNDWLGVDKCYLTQLADEFYS